MAKVVLGVIAPTGSPLLGDLTAGLSEAFTHIEESFPDFKAPRVAAVVTGFMGPDLVVSDSLIVIGLDYFIGPEAKYRPRDLPQYILRRYQQAYVVPAIVFALSDRYNFLFDKDVRVD